MSHIKIKELSKIYNVNNKDLYAINNLSLLLDINQNTVIIGKSGSGKSTLLNLINGLISPEYGDITYPELFKSSTVFQEATLLPWLTIKENAVFWNTKADAASLLEEFELSNFKTLYPHEVSGGMKAKTALIRALLHDTDYILLDEPFVSLDYFSRMSIQQKLLHSIKKQNKGLLFVTHNIEEALILGDRIIILDKGKIIADKKNIIDYSKRSYKNIDNNLRNQLLDYLQ